MDDDDLFERRVVLVVQWYYLQTTTGNPFRVFLCSTGRMTRLVASQEVRMMVGKGRWVPWVNFVKANVRHESFTHNSTDISELEYRNDTCFGTNILSMCRVLNIDCYIFCGCNFLAVDSLVSIFGLDLVHSSSRVL